MVLVKWSVWFAISNHKTAHFFQLQMNVADVIGQLVSGSGERVKGLPHCA